MGIEKGREEGEKLALQKVVQKLLERGVENHSIAEATGLPEQVIDTLRNPSSKP